MSAYSAEKWQPALALTHRIPRAKEDVLYVLLAELMNSTGKSFVSVGGIGGEYGSMAIVLDASRVLGSMESCRKLSFT